MKRTNRMTRACESAGPVTADDLTAGRIAVTSLLYNEGGWWSPSCILSAWAARVPGMPLRLFGAIVRLALAELVSSGDVEIGTADKLREPLFRYAASPANTKSPGSG